MTHYKCSHCKYAFERPKMPNICPYCSRPNTLTVPQSASELLKDVE